MPRYYVNNNAQDNGDHEVHVEGCTYLALVQSNRDLGYHPNCQSAVASAKVTHPTANGCYWCSTPCHTS
jgi:hypothetical protein